MLYIRKLSAGWSTTAGRALLLPLSPQFIYCYQMRRWTWLPSTDYGHTPALHNLYQRLADMLTPFTSYYHFPITLTFQLCQHSLLGKTCQVQRVFQSNSLRSPLHQLAFGRYVKVTQKYVTLTNNSGVRPLGEWANGTPLSADVGWLITSKRTNRPSSAADETPDEWKYSCD